MKRLVSLFLILLIIPAMSHAMKEEEESGIPRFKVTPETLAKHETAFKKYIQETEQNIWPKLRDLLDPDTWSGWALTGAVNAFYVPFSEKPKVRPKEARMFLGRVFSKPSAGTEYKIPEILELGIKKLKETEDSEYFSYISNVLSQMTNRDLKKGSIKHLPDIMEVEKKKYENMPGSRNMDNKEEVPDEIFAQFAVAQMFTTCCIEERLLLSESEKTSHHPHSRSPKLHTKSLES